MAIFESCKKEKFVALLAIFLIMNSFFSRPVIAQYALGISVGKGSPISTSGFINYSISDGESPPAFLGLNLAGKDFNFSPFTLGATLRVAGKNYEDSPVAVSLPIYLEVGFGSGKLPLRGDVGVAVKFGEAFSVEAIGAIGFQYLSISNITSAVVTGTPPFTTKGQNVVTGDKLDIVNQNLYYKAAAKARYRVSDGLVPFVQLGFTSTFGEAGTQIKNQTTGEEIGLTFFSQKPSVDIKGLFFQAGLELLF